MISTWNNIQLFIQVFIYTKVIIKASRKKKNRRTEEPECLQSANITAKSLPQPEPLSNQFPLVTIPTMLWIETHQP